MGFPRRETWIIRSCRASGEHLRKYALTGTYIALHACRRLCRVLAARPSFIRRTCGYAGNFRLAGSPPRVELLAERRSTHGVGQTVDQVRSTLLSAGQDEIQGHCGDPRLDPPVLRGIRSALKLYRRPVLVQIVVTPKRPSPHRETKP